MLIQKSRIPIKDILLYGFLPSFIKKILYRLKGYKIGKRVSIGFGSVIIADEVHIGSYTQIGFLTIIRGKRISIGDYVSIGSTVFLDTPYLEIGEGSKINEQVFIGGLQFPDSKFVMGRNCQIMQMTFINPARYITVGDDSGIGGHCLLFGHTSWLSHFEGYPVEFQPIEIGKSVSIAWGAFILPGSQIGDGAVIGARSVVSRTIPPKCLALGYPARVVSKYPDFPKELSDNELLEILQKVVSEMIDYFRDSGLNCEGNDNNFRIVSIRKFFLIRRKKIWRLKVRYDAPIHRDIQDDEHTPDVFLSLKYISPQLRSQLSLKKVVWIDIENKEQSLYSNELGDEVILFLKRYGIRLFRANT
ncbi:MAG: acyltransferase [bacterium]